MDNRSDNVCLTVSCRGINPKGPGRVRAKANETEEQHCYFNIKTNHKLHNTFVRNRIRNSTFDIDSVHFQMELVLGKSKTSETYDATAELKELLGND